MAVLRYNNANWDEMMRQDRKDCCKKSECVTFFRKHPISEIYPILFKLHNFAHKIVILLETIQSWQIKLKYKICHRIWTWQTFQTQGVASTCTFSFYPSSIKPDSEARSSPNIAQHIISHSKVLSLRKNVLQTGYIYWCAVWSKFFIFLNIRKSTQRGATLLNTCPVISPVNLASSFFFDQLLQIETSDSLLCLILFLPLWYDIKVK